MEVQPIIHNTRVRERRNLTDKERNSIYEILLRESNNGKIPRGSIFKTVAAQFSVSIDSIRRVWARALEAIANDVLHVNVSSRMQGNVGSKKIVIEHEKINQVPWRRRKNIRSFANALGVSKSTLHRRVEEGFLRPHSNTIKPLLNDENKKNRVRFCLSLVDTQIPHNPNFFDMYDYVHIDEKWFYMSKETQRYYMLPSEEQPLRTCQSKSFIPKVMFLAVVARPRYDGVKDEMFDGKIGIFPFTYMEPAKRNSKNRTAGTLEMKSMTSIKKDLIRSFLIDKVLPAIREKWPQDGPRKIIIQQYNARPHIQVNDVDFNEAATLDGFEIRLRCQPPNSPDLNVLDLGYFRAIQSLQHQEAPKNITELVQAVEESFRLMNSESLTNVFLTLQLCMVEVMKCHGGNNYKIPHIGKKRLERQGIIPTRIDIDNDIVVEAQNYIRNIEA